MAIFLPDETEFRARKFSRERGASYNDKRAVEEESIAILTFYAPNNRDAKYVEQKLIKLEK